MKRILWILVVALIFRIIISFITYHPDLNNHIDWGIRFWQYGAFKFFSPETNVWSYTWPNQPPGTIYLFAGIRKVFEFLFNLLSVVHFKLNIFPGSWLLFLEKNLYPALLKLPSILSDLGIGILIYKFIYDIGRSSKKATIGMIVWLFNPVVWYNSSLWGQTDAIINFLALWAFYLLFRKRLSWAVLAILISFYIKASLIIFLPIFIIVALGQKYSIKKWTFAIFVSVIIITILTLPFSKGNPLIWLFNLYENKVFGEQLHLITANAFNLWSILTGIHERPDSLVVFGLTYKFWGYLIFSAFYIPVVYISHKNPNEKNIIWSLALAAFSSFMLLTNMHERYLYPLFPYFTILMALNFDLIANYTAVSIVSLLNLYNFWWFPFIPSLVEAMSLNDRIAPRILGALNFLMFLFLYIRFLRLLKPAKI